MTKDVNRESTKIYQFPAHGRFATRDRGDGSVSTAVPRLPLVESAPLGAAWYHEEAIQEELARNS
jgi:uncharacterized protein DUF2735